MMDNGGIEGLMSHGGAARSEGQSRVMGSETFVSGTGGLRGVGGAEG